MCHGVTKQDDARRLSNARNLEEVAVDHVPVFDAEVVRFATDNWSVLGEVVFLEQESGRDHGGRPDDRRGFAANGDVIRLNESSDNGTRPGAPADSLIELRRDDENIRSHPLDLIENLPASTRRVVDRRDDAADA